MTNAPERIWIDGAVANNEWHEREAGCMLSGVAAREYVRADLAGKDEFFFCAMEEIQKLRALLDEVEAKRQTVTLYWREGEAGCPIQEDEDTHRITFDTIDGQPVEGSENLEALP